MLTSHLSPSRSAVEANEERDCPGAVGASFTVTVTFTLSEDKAK